MFALVKREIYDNAVFFLGAIVLSAILIGTSIATLDNHHWIDKAIFGSGRVLVIVVLGFFGMGAVQMDTDKIRRISAFVSTLSVSRNRILLAKIIAGLLAILIVLVPLAVTATVLLQIHAPPVPVFATMLVEVFTGTFLAAFACYCIGLQAGWSRGRLWPVLAGIVLTCILASLIGIKGFAPDIMKILSLFIAASLIRTWHLFTSTAL